MEPLHPVQTPDAEYQGSVCGQAERRSRRDLVARRVEVQIDTVLIIESKLFRSAGGDLVWAATSETLKPRTPRQTISSYIGALIRQLYGDQED